MLSQWCKASEIILILVFNQGRSYYKSKVLTYLDGLLMWVERGGSSNNFLNNDLLSNMLQDDWFSVCVGGCMYVCKKRELEIW